MITTKREYQLFVALVQQLDESIKAIGGCDHPVNICICDLISLRAQSEAIVQKHKNTHWFDKSFPFTLPKKKGTPL